MTDRTDERREGEATNTRPIQVKLVLLGEAAVGKSSVVLRFVQNDFQENKEPTIGAAFLTQKCRLDDKVIKFEIWDTAGQERFHSLAPLYYRNAGAAVVVADVTSYASFEKAKSWVKELQRQASPNIVIALVINKLDLVTADDSAPAADDESDEDEADDATATPAAADGPKSPHASGKHERQIAKDEAESYAQEHSLLFFETSAKTGDGIVACFTEIAKKIPLDQYAGTGRSGPGSRNASGRAGASQASTREGRVDLNAKDGADKKDACAC